MDLKIKDVSELLNVSETTIRRWLAESKIPAYRIHGQYRFNRLEIESWVMSHKLGNVNGSSPFNTDNLSSEAPIAQGGSKQFSLFRALNKGEVFNKVPGDTKEDVIRTTTKLLGKTMNLDADVLAELLLDRENLQPTSLNNGFAVPHTRDFLLSAHNDIVAIVFPEKPIPFGALDGLPVHTMIFLFASDDKRHLHLLAKIAHLSSQVSAVSLMQSKPNKNQLLEYVKNWESSIPLPAAD